MFESEFRLTEFLLTHTNLLLFSLVALMCLLLLPKVWRSRREHSAVQRRIDERFRNIS